MNTAVESDLDTSTDVHPDLNSVKPQPNLVDCDMYSYFLQVIPCLLAEPLDAKSIAERLNVSMSQAKTWLRRAVQEDKVQKRGKDPVLYAPSVSLFTGLHD